MDSDGLQRKCISQLYEERNGRADLFSPYWDSPAFYYLSRKFAISVYTVHGRKNF